jgi:hypothetical protein
VGVALVGAVVALGRRSDASAFAAALAASLALTPIVWLHYFALLFVPIAIGRPRLSPLWLAPLAFWATPLPESGGSAVRIALTVLVTAIALVRVDGRLGRRVALAPASGGPAA